MAGSYKHATDDDGRLRDSQTMGIATETQGDAYETIEEMYGMIWYLAARLASEMDPNVLVLDLKLDLRVMAGLVNDARLNYRRGLELSPGSL